MARPPSRRDISSAGKAAPPTGSKTKARTLAAGDFLHARRDIFLAADDDMGGTVLAQRVGFRAAAGHGDGNAAIFLDDLDCGQPDGGGRGRDDDRVARLDRTVGAHGVGREILHPGRGGFQVGQARGGF